jgi:hypothetical protein
MLSSRRLVRRWCVLIGMLAAAAAPATQTHGTAERFTALAVNMGSPARFTTATVELVVNRWSSEAERDRLLSVLLEKGPNQLLEALRETPRVGYIRTPDSIGYDLHYAQKMPGEDGGERVVLATDRYISFWEAVNRPRTIDYPFTVIELRIGTDGKGEGKMSLFAKIVADKKNKTIILEDYGTQPVLLQSVRREVKSN